MMGQEHQVRCWDKAWGAPSATRPVWAALWGLRVASVVGLRGKPGLQATWAFSKLSGGRIRLLARQGRLYEAPGSVGAFRAMLCEPHLCLEISQ